ncbi:MAG: hypothetical protein KGY75_00900 [Candidatus Cloacimonetes bacterium]|nr:hypothetical protein [Candidatus Cloacimonadota bacterium]MBS3766674.1 hypothetical protein [Candidatus Cloacimonadota bacterium]
MNLYSLIVEIEGGVYIGQENASSPIKAIVKWIENLDHLIIMSSEIEVESIMKSLEQDNEIEINEPYDNMWEISIPKSNGKKFDIFYVVKTFNE